MSQKTTTTKQTLHNGVALFGIIQGLLGQAPTGAYLPPPDVIWAHNYDKGDGDGPMFRRALDVAIPLGKDVEALAGFYEIGGTSALLEGLIGLEGEGRIGIVCRTGYISFQAPPGTSRALLSLSGGADYHFDGVEFDGTNCTSNFAAKINGAGRCSGGRVMFRGKSARWLGDIGEFDVDLIECNEIIGHAISFGNGTCPGGRIGKIKVRNSTKSGFNPSGMLCASQLLIGELDARWTKWESDRIQYPSQYAVLRSGNGSRNISILKVYAEGYYRGVRITDGDHVWVEWLDFKNLLANAVLLNSKDQIARASGVGLITGVGPSRGNGLATIADVDGTEAFDGPSDVIAVAAGAGWTVGKAAVEADTYLLGLGTITATAGSTTVTNRDYSQQGKDFNCFKPIEAGDFLFDNQERVLGRATGNPDGSLNGTSTATNGSNQLVGVGTSYLTQLSTGDIVIGSNGSHVCRVLSIQSETALTMVAPYAGVDGANLADDLMTYTTRRYWTDAGETTPAALRPAQSKSTEIAAWLSTIHHASQTMELRHGSLQSVAAGIYYQRTVDSYFFAPGTGLMTASTASPNLTGSGGSLFSSQFAAGDAIFNANGDLVREIATAPTATSATLTGNALVNMTAAPFFVGRWKKATLGLRVYPEATETNINPDDIYVRGAVQQHNIYGPALRTRPQAGVLKAQLASIKAVLGELRYVTDLNPPGFMVGDGTDWVKTGRTGITANGSVEDITHVYLDAAPTTRLSGNISTDKSVTLSEVGLPHGAAYKLVYQAGGTGSRLIKNAAGSTLATLRPGQFCIVEYDKTVPVWRVSDIGFATASLALPRVQLLTKAVTTGLLPMELNGVIRVDASGGARTITLPDAATLLEGTWVTVKKSDTTASKVVLLFTGSATEQAWLRTQHDTVEAFVVGGVWMIRDFRIAPFEYLETTSGTWTKPPLISRLDMWLVGGGAGGGSGRRGAAGTVRCGGNGGGGATVLRASVMGSLLPASTTITMGNGGAGGAAVTVDDTNGNNGSNGSATLFGTAVSEAFYQRSGTPAIGGTGGNAAGTVPTAPIAFDFTPGIGGANSATGGVGGIGGIGYSMGAGAGGGITTANASSAGGAGRLGLLATLLSGGAAGSGATPGGVGASTPAFVAGVYKPPSSAAGGGSGGTSSAGGDGGVGLEYGSPGGGGGASLNGFASGAGGAGAPGCIRFIEWF